MKRFLSLIIAVVMVLSLGVATVFAADFGYNVHNFTSGANAMNDGIIPIFVRSVGATIGGTFKIKYDSSKVLPMVYSTYTDDETGEDVVEYIDATASTKGSDLVVYVKGSSPSDKAQRFDYAAATIEVDVYSGTAITNNQQFLKIYFKALDGTTDNWDENTFKLVSGFIKDADQNQYEFADMAKTHTYTNATVPGATTPEEPGVGGNDSYEATPEDVATVTDWKSGFKYDTDASAVENTVEGYDGKKVVTFGKAATALTTGAYGVQIGNRTYAGGMDVDAGSYFAIIIINSNSDAAILDSYTYKVWTGSEDAPEFQTGELNAVVAR